jgi:hypothetical protein
MAFLDSRHSSSSLGVAFANPSQLSSAKSIDLPKTPVALNYRSSSYDEGLAQDLYTDRLWQSALVADSIRLELQPVHGETTSKSKDHGDGLIETAKAFLPVAIEIGAVCAIAATVNPIMN